MIFVVYLKPPERTTEALQDQENYLISDFLKSSLINKKITGGMIVESRPPNITRGSGEVRKVKLTPAISSPAPAAARLDSEIRKSLDEMPGIISLKATRRFTHANA